MDDSSRTRLLVMLLLLALVAGGGGYYKFVYLANKDEAAAPATAAADSTPAANPATTPAANPATTPAVTPTPDATSNPAPTGTPTTPATPTPGASAAGATAATSPRLLDRGGASGNTGDAASTAQLVQQIALKSQLQFVVAVSLVPARGGLNPAKKAIKKYRAAVTGASMRVEVADASLQQWTSGSAASRTNIVIGFLKLLGGRYPHAQRSVTFVGPDKTVLAIGDVAAAVKPTAAAVKVYG